MDTSNRNRSPIGSQFSIKRLFWTLIVASVIFKIADMSGLLSMIAGNWEFARGNNRVIIIISIIVFTVIAIIYIAWLGIRLPHLIDQYLAVEKKRKERRSEYFQISESQREQRSE